VLQSAGLAVLVIAPLFAKPAQLVERIMVPVPPYSHRATPRARTETNADRATRPQCVYCPFSRNITPITRAHESGPIGSTIDPNWQIDLPGPAGPLNIVDTRQQPIRPDEQPQVKRRIHETSVDPAMLTRRVEPVYPAIPKQLHRGGKVELRAVIGTDGSIQSLEVVSGDPMFVQSALDAVRQWHYKPTYLNGQPVEIDTFITVIYTMQQ
jgi:protein TonB